MVSTNRLMLSLWLFGAAIYTAHAVYIGDAKCRSEVPEAAAEYSVKGDNQHTGSVGQTPPTLKNNRSAKIRPESSRTEKPEQGAEVSLSATAHALPQVWGIRVIDPHTLREGWMSGNYLTPTEEPQALTELPQKPAQPGPEASAVSEQLQPEPSATPKHLRKQRAWKWRRRPAFRYELGFYPTW